MVELIVYVCYGIDIGGIKIELVVCDVVMQVIWCCCVVMLQGDYDGFLQVVVMLVVEVDVVLGWNDVVIGIVLFGVCDCCSGCQFSVNVFVLIGQCVVQDLQVWL